MRLFYFGQDEDMMTTSLRTEPFGILETELLFETPRINTATAAQAGPAHYDIDPKGERFLMLDLGSTDGERPQINVVQNWFEELKERVPIP